MWFPLEPKSRMKIRPRKIQAGSNIRNACPLTWTVDKKDRLELKDKYAKKMKIKKNTSIIKNPSPLSLSSPLPLSPNSLSPHRSSISFLRAVPFPLALCNSFSFHLCYTHFPSPRTLILASVFVGHEKEVCDELMPRRIS